MLFRPGTLSVPGDSVGGENKKNITYNTTFDIKYEETKTKEHFSL